MSTISQLPKGKHLVVTFLGLIGLAFIVLGMIYPQVTGSNLTVLNVQAGSSATTSTTGASYYFIGVSDICNVQPLQGATVTFQGQTQTTDNVGLATFHLAASGPVTGVAIASASGFWSYSQIVTVVPNGSEYLLLSPSGGCSLQNYTTTWTINCGGNSVYTAFNSVSTCTPYSWTQTGNSPIFTTTTGYGGQMFSYSLQAGAWSDPASIGNTGVKATIQTITENLQGDDHDSFWVGDNLVNGAFIQFGYNIFSTVNGFVDICTTGTVAIGGYLTCSSTIPTFYTSGQSEWFWQYWPNVTSTAFQFGYGPAGSAGANNSLNTYQISPGTNNNWQFILNGNVIYQSSIPVTMSAAPLYVSAEKVSSAINPTVLGPVTFSGMTFYKSGAWVTPKSLVSFVDCVTPTCPTGVHPYTSSANIPYGVVSRAANSITAGSGEPHMTDGTVLWGNPANLYSPVPIIVSTSPSPKYSSPVTAQIILWITGLAFLFAAALLQIRR